jgi:hypothetical protein
MRTLTITTARTDGHDVLDLIEYRGVTIARQYDKRGPAGEWFYYAVTVEWQGEECAFNSVTGARRFIEEELDTDVGFDKAREWGIGRNRAC